MSTRWKRESPDTLILLHAHNIWSKWYGYLITSAVELGIPYSTADGPNYSGDGSWDRRYLVPKGCKNRIFERAIELRNKHIAALSDW